MKKGISLVALVITIIVLIILTAAVFLTGGSTPENAKKAVFMNDVSTIQDAVILYKLDQMAITNGEKVELRANTTTPVCKVAGVDYYPILPAALENVPGITADKWAISETGTVILRTGVVDDTATFFNTGISASKGNVAVSDANNSYSAPVAMAAYTK